MSSTLDEHVYDDLIDKDDTKTKSQRSCLDSLQSRNSNSTIPVSQRFTSEDKECLLLGSLHLSSSNFLMLISGEEQSNISIV
jgi:hypothetical protein